MHRLSHMDKRALTSRAHPANRALVLTLIAVPRLQTSADIAPAPHVMPRQGAVCLSLRGTSATPPGRGRQVLGNNEASHDAGTVGYSRYACRDFILTADFVNEIRVRLAGTVSVRCSSREIKGEAFEDRRAANRCTNLSPPSSTKMLALLQAFLVALNRAPKLIWNSFYCPSPLTAGRALGALGPVAIPGLAGHQAGDDNGVFGSARAEPVCGTAFACKAEGSHRPHRAAPQLTHH